MTEPGRTRWTDERIDDLALGVREEIRELRAEMREGFRELRAEMRDMRADIRQLNGEVVVSRRWLVNMWATSVLGFVALLLEVGLR